MLGSILGAVGSIAGGLLGNKSAKKAAEKNYEQQKEFAQNGLKWNVAQAKELGISKLVAAGMPTQSYAPSNVGGNFDFLGNAGQNIGRALAAGQGPGGAGTAVPRAAAAVQLEGLQLDNDIKRAQIASLNKTLTQPGTAAPYGSPNGTVIDGPTLKLQTNRDLARSDEQYSVPGAGPDVTFTHTNTGGYTWDTPPQLAESRESDPWMKRWGGFVRNGIVPFLDPHGHVPREIIENAPPGTVPRLDPLTQEWKYVRAGGPFRETGRHIGLSYGYKKYFRR